MLNIFLSQNLIVRRKHSVMENNIDYLELLIQKSSRKHVTTSTIKLLFSLAYLGYVLIRGLHLFGAAFTFLERVINETKIILLKQ